MKKHNNLKYLVDNGFTVAEISRELEVTSQYVYRLMKNMKMVGITRRKREKALEMISSGLSNSKISKKLNIRSLVINNLKRRLPKKCDTNCPLTKWCEKTFLDVKTISKKYHKKMSMIGIEIDVGDIESTIIDLIMHTDQKDISNKDAYFRKYCPLKVSNLSTKTISCLHKSLVNVETGEEVFCTYNDPEKILIALEEYGIDF